MPDQYTSQVFISYARSDDDFVDRLEADLRQRGIDTVTLPLAFRVYKPKSRLKAGDTYKSKPQLAIELVQKPQTLGFQFSVVLADSLYGESGEFLAALQRLGLQYVVAIHFNHGGWMFPGRHLRRTRWRPFARVFTDGSAEQCFIRETVFGRRQGVRYFQIRTDPATLSPESTWDLMTNLPGKIERTVGKTFGLRTWIAYGFKQAKDELGWADYCLTEAASIEHWWELVMCAYLLVSLQAPVFAPTNAADTAIAPATSAEPSPLSSIPSGPTMPVGNTDSIPCTSSCSPSSAPASSCRGCTSTPCHTSRPVWPTFVP